MPIFRNKDGNVAPPNIDESPTHVLDRQQQQAQQSAEIPTDYLGGEPATILETPNSPPTRAASAEEPKTVLLGANKRKKKAKEEDADDMADPVVAWVVIVKGAGQGKAIKLGYGQNTIGRGSSQRVSLDFGTKSDMQVSALKHAVITFDPKGKKYYLQSGDGTNLTYLDDAPVLVPVEIKGGEEIVMGETHLRFVPFCGEDFDWNS